MPLTSIRSLGVLCLLAFSAAQRSAADDLQKIPDRVVVLTFDDSVKSHYSYVAPLLKRYGFGATFFITEGFSFATNKKDYMTWKEIRSLHDMGFEIGNHTQTHLSVNERNVDQLDRELTVIESRCKEHGIPKPQTFAWPGNALSEAAFKVLDAHGIRYARRGGAPEYPYDKGRGFAYDPSRDHPLLIPSAGDARPKWSLADFRRAATLARAGRIAVLQFHGVPDNEHPWVHTSKERFLEYMNFLRDENYTVLALKDLDRYVDSTKRPSHPWNVVEERKCSLGRKRARELGFGVGTLPTGDWNAITDVPGVLVGHRSIWKGSEVRTGITAILPHGGDLFRKKVPAAFYRMNGFGKPFGVAQIRELGEIETPILLGGTLCVPRIADGVLDYVLANDETGTIRSINPVVGETNDGYLSDIRSRPVSGRDVRRAIEGARSGAVAEGSVGAGTGTRCLGFKGGIGTSSRVVEIGKTRHTIGVLVQSNFGGKLSLLREAKKSETKSNRDGSCAIVIGTDAPLTSRQLERLAKRAFAGMARTGASFSNGSGDYAFAFSTQVKGRADAKKPLSERSLSPFFLAVADATEEAIYNSLLQARTVRGRAGHVSRELPFERLKTRESAKR